MKKNNLENKLSSNFKDIYKEVNRLNTDFYVIFKRMSQMVRLYRGHQITEILIQLENQVADTYFGRDERHSYQDRLKDMYLTLKHLEFNLRICYDLNFIDEKSRETLNKTIGVLSMLIKEEMKTVDNELFEST